MTDDFYIFDAVRTVRGKARENGGLAKVAPVDLVKQTLEAIDQRNGKAAQEASSLTLGCVGQVAGQGGHIALVSKLVSGLSDDVVTCTLNNYCVSGMTVLGYAMGRVMTGQEDLALAGGVESMSQVPFMADKATFYTDPKLSARAGYVPVVVSAELLAQTKEVDRETLDQVTLRSQTRAQDTDSDEDFQKSRLSVNDDEGKVVLDRDETLRGTSLEKLRSLEPAFGKFNAQFQPIIQTRLPGVELKPAHTIAHAPPMCDGAAMMLLGNARAAEKFSLTPRARVSAYTEAAGDSTLGLTAGLKAFAQVLERAGWKSDDVDVFEIMESFAVFPALMEREMNLDPEKVNLTGGHLAKGHPLGATGAVLISTLLDIMEHKSLRRGVAVTAGASGIGAAVALERV